MCLESYELAACMITTFIKEQCYQKKDLLKLSFCKSRESQMFQTPGRDLRFVSILDVVNISRMDRSESCPFV